MIVNRIAFSVREILEKVSRANEDFNKIDMDFPTQRYAGQWNAQKESELIRSILLDDPIPPLFLRGWENDMDSIYQLIDGKQRVSTIVKFVTSVGKPMKLHKDIEPIEVVNVQTMPDGTRERVITNCELAGKTFAQLPKKLQTKILDYVFDIKLIVGGSQKDIDRIMVNLNNGVSPSGSDKAKMVAGQDIMNKIVSIASTNPLFVCDLVFSPNQIKKNAYEECILYSLIQYTGKDIDSISYTALQPKQLEKIIKQNADCWNDNMFRGLNEIFTELHNALPDNSELTEPYLNKKHLPVLVMNVDTFLAKYTDGEITKEQYRTFMYKWFTEGIKSQEFYNLVVEDNKNISKRYNIEARISLMDTALKNFIATGELGLTKMQAATEISEDIIEPTETKNFNDSSEIAIKEVYSIKENMKKELNIDDISACVAIYTTICSASYFTSLDDFDQAIRALSECDLSRIIYASKYVTSVIKDTKLPQKYISAYFGVYKYSEEHGYEDFKNSFERWFNNIKDKPIPKDEIKDLIDMTRYLTNDFKQFIKQKEAKKV